MASVTVTETGVVLQVTISRDENGTDQLSFSAISLTDVPEVQGRQARDVPVNMTPAQASYVAEVMNFIESLVKAQWQIP